MFAKILERITLEKIAPVVLVFLCLFILYRNWVPGTILSGWDTLHPEFNFSLNFERLIFGVFREEQGLGAVAAHSHMSDLPRVLILFISSFMFPVNFLRFFYIGLCLVVGVLGTYFFIKEITFAEKNKKCIVAFLGALFYLFNLGTLQHFYVPFEMFTVQYAFLPWLFLTATKYLGNPIRRNLLAFSVLTLLAAPMAYASTLWFAYFLALTSYLLFFARKNIKRVLIVILVTLAINSFWLLPNLYFLTSGNASFVPQARINKIFSEEAFNYNKSYGNIPDTLILKNFLFDWPIYTGDDQFRYLLEAWRQHLQNPFILYLGYCLSLIVIIGVIYTLITPKRNRAGFYLMLPLAISLLFLVNASAPLDIFFNALRENSAIFKEALRTPFTKFSIILIFGFSTYFALGNLVLINFFESLVKKIRFNLFKNGLLPTYTLMVTLLLVIFCWPFFKGELISKKMQVKIPTEYYEMFDWFNQQPEGRVANLPIHSLWGWIYYNWGFQGAQFISFGIKNPLLDRDYDRWSIYNEQYYQEMSSAIYAQDLDSIEKVITKFNIRYFLLDENVLAPGLYQDKKVLYFDQIKSLLASSNNIRTVKQLNNLTIYETNLSESNDLVLKDDYIKINGPSGSKNSDSIYSEYGDYILSNSTNLEERVLYTPFNVITDNQNLIREDLIKVESNNIRLKPSYLPANAIISAQQYYELEKLTSAEVYIKKIDEELILKLAFNLFLADNDNKVVEKEYNLGQDSNLKSGSLFINLDNFQTLKFENKLTEKYFRIGTFYLKNDSYNNIALYGNSNKTIEFLTPKVVDLCGDTTFNQIVGGDFSQKNIKLSAQKANACVRIPLRFIDTQLTSYKSLFKLDFTVNSKDNVQGHYCIFSKILNRCIKEVDHITPTTTINEFLTIDGSESESYDLVLYLDNKNEKLTNISYDNLSFTILDPVKILTINPLDIQEQLSSYKKLITKEGEIVINYKDENIISPRNLFDDRTESKGCGNVLSDNYKRSVDHNNNFIEYSSLGGSSCDYFSFPNLPHAQGYVLALNSQNVFGLPLRICIANNYSKRCDVYLSLPLSKYFKNNNILIPPINDGSSGYDIHIENYSAGKVESTNRVSNLKIYPIPYNWITQMKFSVASDLSAQSLDSSLHTKSLVPGIYEIDYKGGKDSLIVLNKSYEKGWVLLGSADHVKVNNWQNGWITKSGLFTKSFVIYAPQFLELGGFLLVGLCFYLVLSTESISIKRLLPSSIRNLSSMISLNKSFGSLSTHSIKIREFLFKNNSSNPKL